MPEANSTTWLTVSDFTAGIRQILNANSLGPLSPQHIGTASAIATDTSVATWGCIALKNGGIGPLPFKFGTISLGPTAGGGPNFATKLSPYWIGGLHIPQVPSFDSGVPPGAYSIDSASIFVSLNYVDAGPVHKYRLYRDDAANTGTFAEIQDNGGLLPFYTSPVTADFVHGGFTPMCDYRSSGAGAPTTPGTPYVIIGACDPGTLGVRVFQYPRPTFNGRMGNYVTMKNPVHLLSHQGRLFVNGYNTPYLLDLQSIIHNDDTFWTIANQDTYDNGGLSSSLTQATVGTYGSFGSASASELVAIRATSYGGLTISSDLNDPIITDYAGIQGTNGCHIQGCWTPIGYVYASLNGSVNVYAGGGRSQDIASELENGFWHSTLPQTICQNVANSYPSPGTPGIPFMGKIAYHSGFIFMPGNWLYEIASNSWWRFKTPGNAFASHYFASSPLGHVYASDSTWVNGSQGFLSQAAFETSAADQWQWTSQLIPIAQETEMNEVLDFTLVGLVTTNSAFFAVAITSYPNNVTVFLPAFQTTDPSSTPKIYRTSLPSTLRGTHVVVRVLAVGSVGGSAPTMLRFDLGLAKSVQVKNQTLAYS